MSAGVFVRSAYAASYGDGTNIHPIRVQPETIAAAIGGTTNSAPSGATNNPISAVISRGKNARGLSPRFVTLQAPEDEADAPDGYKPGGITRIPALQAAFWNAATTGTIVVYLGSDFQVVSRSPEEAK